MKNKYVSALLLTAGAAATSLSMGCTRNIFEPPTPSVYGPPEYFGVYDTEYVDEDTEFSEDTEVPNELDNPSTSYDPSLDNTIDVYGPPEFFD